ncbi:hypothetical protein HHI36_022709 [Cryptolaemus montrouzieri]|uniref:DAN domain-containing protein n=1 Tax=Cryptolaemus montrouzieri TaxID=559131 RepID=A0ABD2N0K1_9CUCU
MLKKCGIWPYNSSVLSESDFDPSLITDIPQIEREPITEKTAATTTATEAQPIIVTELNYLEVIPLVTYTTTISSPTPGCSCWLPLILQILLLLRATNQAFSEREHKVHNIVLFREKYSWCKLTPIQQIIASPGYDSITINNNICVGACYSYSIPKTQPAEPGEIIGPYCDSCQPNVTKCYHITLKADGTNLLGPRIIQKQVEIIESCDCKTCDKNPKVDCELSEESTIELPQHLYTNKDTKSTTTMNPSELPDADLMDLKPEIKVNRIAKLPQEDSNNVERKYDLTSKLLKLLKAIQNEPSNTILKYDKDEIKSLVDMVQGPEKRLDDKNLLEFVNYVNSNNIDDFELDIQKLKEVLLSYQKNKDLIEKHRNFWFEFSDNAKIEEDLKKLRLPESFGLEGSTLGLKHHYTGSHIGMGIKSMNDMNAPTLVTLKIDQEVSSTSQKPPEASSEPAKHHHYIMEEENVAGKREHLVKGPHGSLVLTPDIKVEEKLNLETDALKPNHQGVVISYTGDDQSRPNLLDD